jgi:sialate O-acetylesterase
MIAPLTPYTIKGAIWYQGESNADRAFQYGTSFPLMIQDWRTHWGEGNFPFYFCQLANFMPHKPAPNESTWAEVRDAQAKTLSLPNTGMAVLIDCGDEANIHPHDKQTPGERLAAVALANTYGKRVPFAGPTYASMAVEGDSIRVSFTHADGGLVAKPLPAEYAPTSEKPDTKVPLVRNVPNSQLEGFAICGEDHVWKWANATIDKETVVVRADGVAKPVAVRYAWADNPICNLYNGAGFPASPFRTDNFPEITRNGKL